MATSTQLIFDILANDRASKTIEGIGGELDRNAGRWDGWAAKAQAASAAVLAGLAAFGVTSVKAYADAEEKQKVLEDAYQRFPALADVSIEKLREQAAALQAKTGADGDAINSAQGLLAQFGLTGSQIEQLTPLMVDYAAKTGKDLPTAAEDLGKALLGQGRSLKSVGIDFTDAGSTGANFDQIMAGLSTNVAGFGEVAGGTASGKVNILKESFGDLQEAVGEQLMPPLTNLAQWATTAIGWMTQHRGLVMGLGAGMAVLAGTVLAVNAATTVWNALQMVARAATVAWTGVQWLLNAALTANPIGLVVVAIAALVAAIVLAWQHSETFRNIVTGAWNAVKGAIETVANWWTQTAYPAISAAVTALGQFFQNVGTVIGNVWAGIRSAIDTAWQFIWNYVLLPIRVEVAAVQWAFQVASQAIGAAWEWIRSALATGWDWIRTNVFDRISAGIDVVRRAFQTGVDLIGQAWDTLRSKAEAPVKFVIDTVLNNGIIRAINNISTFLTGSNAITPISYGGAGAGSGSGRPPAIGGAGSAPFGGVTDFIAGIADGVVDLLSDPAGFIKNLGANLMSGLGSNPFTAVLAGIPGKIASWVAQWVSKIMPAGPTGTAGRVLPAGSYTIGMPFHGYPGHEGADYPAPMGTPIFAPWAGVVSRAVSLATSYGRHVFLDHGGGIQTRYAHMLRYVVGAGQVVAPGQLIGYVDSTGNSTGSHLHFEYRRNGVAINPATLGLFDRGGWLPHGGMALNLSGSPERVLSPEESRSYGPDALREALDGARLELVGVGALTDSVSARIVLASTRRAGRT